MSRKELLRLLSGFRRFREKYFESENPLYRKLAGVGQSPKTLVIACSDSRVDPAIITEAGPGDLFVLRNVANIVPPFEKGGGFHGTSAAIEFAVETLKVEQVVILGHRQCGGIRALVTGVKGDSESFLTRWMAIVKPAHLRVQTAHPGANEDTLCQACELEAIKISIENLRTFPFIQKAEAERGMAIIGAYFDLEAGRLLELDEASGEFKNIDI